MQINTRRQNIAWCMEIESPIHLKHYHETHTNRWILTQATLVGKQTAKFKHHVEDIGRRVAMFVGCFV